MSEQSITILGIESSCDDTGAAVIRNLKVLSNEVAGQAVHAKFGGVVPELASRAHQQNIIPVVELALRNAGVRLSEIDAIAYTKGPGLLGSLLVGSSFAKGLSLGSEKPLIEVNHMQAHILAHFIEGSNIHNTTSGSAPSFPFLCLTVSGGHTQIVRVDNYTSFKLLGETTDDAAGECFDKAAKTLGLPYPGGPLIDKYSKEGRRDKYKFPVPKVSNYDYSFSGLKTSLLYFISDELKKNPEFINHHLNDICASYQETIINYLIKILSKASEDLKIKTIAIAGGVAANSRLRDRLKEEEEKSGWKIFIPRIEYCTDNAAMIAAAGYFKFNNKEFEKSTGSADPRFKI